VEAVIFVPDAACVRADGTPGGLALLERQLRQLRALGHGPATVVLGPGVPATVASDARIAGTRRAATGDPFAALAGVATELPLEFLLLSADHLIDSRVLRYAAATPGDAVLVDANGARRPIGRLARATLVAHGGAAAKHARALRLDAIDPYAPELRGTVAPYCLPMRTPDEQRRAWPLLLDHVQKRGLDIPGAWFDTPFENALVRVLAPTAVTPNQITLATLGLAALVGGLFWQGRLALGLVLALVVGVLDGVDGKLARLKLATSRLGELEHVGDFLYENLWYVALAHGFAVAGGPVFWRAGALLVCCDLVDNLAYGAVSARTGRLLDELSPFDAAFRRVGGRRNVYVWIVLLAACARRAPLGFVLASGWAAVTAAVHVSRALYWRLVALPPAASPDADTLPGGSSARALAPSPESAAAVVLEK
jgi:phosphatidylglycerophosphate synthase